MTQLSSAAERASQAANSMEEQQNYDDLRGSVVELLELLRSSVPDPQSSPSEASHDAQVVTHSALSSSLRSLTNLLRRRS